jgi:preprotein translocase subunit SecE
MRRISDLSIDENAAPKRRSSAANRRRTRRQPTSSQPVQQSTDSRNVNVATAEVEQAPSRTSRLRRKPEPEVVEAVPVEPQAESVLTPEERAAQRREERRKAKQQRPERTGVGRVVNTERVSGLRKFYNDTSSEIRKVVWPDRETTTNLTIVVIAMSAIMGLLLGGIDFVLFRLFEAVT